MKLLQFITDGIVCFAESVVSGIENLVDNFVVIIILLACFLLGLFIGITIVEMGLIS